MFALFGVLVINNINVATAGNYTLTIYYVVSGARAPSLSQFRLTW
jgi:hypothetical protein